MRDHHTKPKKWDWGVWHVNKVFTLHEDHHELDFASNSDNHAEVEVFVSKIHRLAASTSACQKRYAENMAQAVDKKWRTASAVVLAMRQTLTQTRRGTKIAGAAAVAAKKLKDEAAAKRASAAQHATENEKKAVRKATAEYLRSEFGKKHTPTPPAPLERLSKVCTAI